MNGRTAIPLSLRKNMLLIMHEGRQGIDEPAAVSVSINWPRIDWETLSPISGKSSSKFQGTTETTTSTNHQPVDI